MISSQGGIVGWTAPFSSLTKLDEAIPAWR